MSVCACLGPQNGDPACPCAMKSGNSRQPWVRFPELESAYQQPFKVWHPEIRNGKPTGKAMYQGEHKVQVKIVRLKKATP